MHPPLRKAVFPLAGQGTRLFPLTRAIPKELVRVAENKPLLYYALAEAAAAGIEECVFITGAHEAALKAYLEASDAPFPKMKRFYVKQETPKGLGDALLRAAPLMAAAGAGAGGEFFAVLLPDDLILAPAPLPMMAELYRKKGRQLVALEKVPPALVSQYGIAKTGAPEGEALPLEALVEKPAPEEAPSDLAIVGRYILSAALFRHLAETPPGAKGEIQLTDGMARALSSLPLMGVPIQGRRFDCGRPEGLDQAAAALI